MQVNETHEFLSSKKKFNNKALLLKLDETLDQLREDYTYSQLQYKKIICKRDKYRHSVRVLGTKYRILMSVYDKQMFLKCICDHDKYDRLNKDC